MDPISTAIVNLAVAARQHNVQVAVSTSVLRQALDLQQAHAATLLQALPQTQPQPTLATSGHLGTLVDTWA
jgi:hypothetical protein